MRILLARHGTAAAPPGVAVDWTDVELTEAGRRQAEALAERLAAGALERIYSSDLWRALETASIVADRQCPACQQGRPGRMRPRGAGSL